jgi:hypothetical protein
MKKILLYLAAAAILGILITIVPLITIAQIGIGENRESVFYPSSIGQGVRQLDGDYGSNTSNVNNSYVTVLAVSFIIALATFALVGHKAPRRYNLRPGVPPT